MFFMFETHLDRVKAEKLKRRLGCDYFLINESEGRSGGLLMMWRKEISVTCKGVSQYYIDVEIQGNEAWRLTGIYGEPRWDRKHVTWDTLRSLHDNTATPWLVLGDFSEILFHHEKEGGRARSWTQLQAFQDSFMDCKLADIGFLGDIFTWQRGKIRERLDRGVANAQWNMLFPDAQLKNGEMVKSDHRPLIVDTVGTSIRLSHEERPRRFEARWLKGETVGEIVQAAWTRAAVRGNNPSLMAKVNIIHNDLHIWDREVLKKPAQRMKNLKKGT